MGKVKNGIYCYVAADILTNIYRNVPLVVLYVTYHAFSKFWIWLAKFANIIKKSYP